MSFCHDLRAYTNVYEIEPNETQRLWSLMEAPSNNGDNYGLRIQGLLMPPVIGNYTFWITSDDYSELWISTDKDPKNVEQLCFVFWSVPMGEWEMIHSQKSSPILLAANKPYYFQVS